MLEANRIILEGVASYRHGSICSNSQLSGRIQVGKNATIENCVIRGPVVIGEGTTLRDAYIGPFTSIGNNVTIENAEVENSILMDEVSINNISYRIDNSLVGRGAQVYARERRPRAISLVLGDCSLVEI